MAAIRLRGTWLLNLGRFDGKSHGITPMADATLEVTSATRAGIEGKLKVSGRNVLLRGKVKPGNPAIVTLHEVDKSGESIEDGLEAVLYIPPWWPNIDYNYDFITGTMSIGLQSAASSKHEAGTLITVSGVQSFE